MEKPPWAILGDGDIKPQSIGYIKGKGRILVIVAGLSLLMDEDVNLKEVTEPLYSTMLI